MYKHFLSLQWKAFLRSSGFGKSLGLKIFMAFMAIYFAVVFLLLGVGLYPMLQEIYPGEDPLLIVNELVLLWLALELVTRFMLQTLPVMSIKPLLVTPIPKRKVVNYVLLRSFFSFFNILPLLVIMPFAIFTWYKSEISVLAVIGWIIAVYSLSIAVNFANFLLKKKFADNLKALIPYFIVAAGLFLLEHFEIFSITEAFGIGLGYALIYPVLALIPVLLAYLFYKWNQKILERRFYLDESLKGKVEEAQTQDFQWLRKFGSIAPFLQLDLKLIWRNKRPKATIFLSLLMLPYGLLIFSGAAYEESSVMSAFAGIIMTGIFMINFGQFIPAWDSSYYSMMMSQNIRLSKYLASKAGLMIFSIILLVLLSIPYIYFGFEIFLIIVACGIYNIGINVPILLFAGSFNRKRIDLEKSPFMNYQGTGAAQWVVSLPLMIIPILLFWLSSKFGSFEMGVAILSGLGIIGILIRKPLMDYIESAYRNNKYAMINGFKETGE